MDYDGLCNLYNYEKLSYYKVEKIPCINVIVDQKDCIVNAFIDDEYTHEIQFETLHWWSDWSGDEVGYEDVLIVGLYAVKEYPMIELYIDVENQLILDIWVIE